ncbi:pimeloyl-ACP methyl ester carboxylesterase [Nocardia sp. GAS34]|uniref:poly(ethylene terephthalate) hydrolase family protein n=1 Tax=unclassified Nocardia TaxID=2637762 RepID=UPI003D1BDC28
MYQKSTRQRGRVHAVAAAIALSCAAISAVAPAQAAPAYQPAGPVEATYHAAGPHPVARRAGTDCCSSTGDAYDIWYPADLGASGTRRPIITWGDGTMAHPREYDFLLAHLASWGFVVIAPDLTSTGTGAQMLDGVSYLTRQNSDPASVFYRKLDTGAIGAMGHSQGGLGTLNAAAHSNDLVKTAVTIEMPSQSLCSSLPPLIPGKNVCDIPTKLISSSVLLISGTADPIPSSGTSGGMQGVYDALPASIPKARAALINASHNDIQGQPGCTNLGCNDGVDGYLGYLTAWFLDQLRGDTRAHSIFVSGTGEFQHNAHWTDQQSNIH